MQDDKGKNTDTSLLIFNPFCLSIVIIFTQTRLNIVLLWHCLSGSNSERGFEQIILLQCTEFTVTSYWNRASESYFSFENSLSI